MIKFIKEYLKQKLDRKARIKAKKDSVIADYNKLINDFRLIEENPSRFSKKHKIRIKSRIQYLISKGHIVINSKA